MQTDAHAHWLLVVRHEHLKGHGWVINTLLIQDQVGMNPMVHSGKLLR